MHRPSSRRQFLGGSLAAVGAAVLAACGVRPKGDGSPSTEAGPPIPDVTSIDTQWPIKRVIYLMLENRSFNNLFAGFPGAHTTLVGNDNGKDLPIKRCPTWLPGDLPHDREAGIAAVNGGKMDNFRLPERSDVSDYYAYSAVEREDIPNYWTWAEEFVLSDNLFASVLGPSYPNHLAFVAGDPLNSIDNPRPKLTHGSVRGRFKSWGCDSPDDVKFEAEAPDGTITYLRPCFDDVTTVPDQLIQADIPWAYYAPTEEQVGYIWSTLNSFPSIFETDQWQHVRPVDSLIDDIKAGRLPAVTWIVPRYELSDHPPWTSAGAHNWTTEIVNAVMQGPMWEHTAIFITWDEWGGFYDPVPPPQVDHLGLGVRVPMITISPYAQRGMIDHEVGEFVSPLKFIQKNWGLRHHTERIRRTHDFSHAFDFRRPPREPLPLEPLPLDFDPMVPPSGPDPSWPKQFHTIEDLGI